MTAGIERVKYYSDIATEKPYERDEKAKLDEPARKIEVAPHGWPSRGVIEFRNVCARYRKELDLVLDTVSFDVSSGQKVGVYVALGARINDLNPPHVHVDVHMDIIRQAITSSGLTVRARSRVCAMRTVCLCDAHAFSTDVDALALASRR
eukprot:COSAG02_NODE_2431_length_8875_cov_9.810164_9_plen_150_part_00